MTIPLSKLATDKKDDDTASESPTEELGGVSDARALALELVPELASHSWTDRFFDDDDNERDIAAVFDHTAHPTRNCKLFCYIFLVIPYISFIAIFLWCMTVSAVRAASYGVAIFCGCFALLWTGVAIKITFWVCHYRAPFSHTAVTADGVLHKALTSKSTSSSSVLRMPASQPNPD